MKLVLYLNPNLPKTHRIPAVPHTSVLMRYWEELCHAHQFCDSDEDERREMLALKIKKFIRDIPFRDQILIMEVTYFLGSGAALRGYGLKKGESFQESKKTAGTMDKPMIPTKHFETHPDNIPLFNQELLVGWDVREYQDDYKWSQKLC